MFRKTQKKNTQKEEITHSLIFLHGFTMDSSEMEYFRKNIDRILPEKIKFKYIFPDAPKRRITYFDSLDKYPAWFDYLTDNSSLKIETEDVINIKHLIEQRKRLHKLIRKEIKYHKGDSSKVFIGGYSQGACMALDTGLTFPKKLGGIIGFKGHILGYTDIAKQYKQNIFVTHSKGDKTIFFSIAKNSYLKYKKKGFNIKFIVQNRGNHNMGVGKKKNFAELQKWLAKYLKIE